MARRPHPRAPFLRRISTTEVADDTVFPFSLPALHGGLDLSFEQPVTLFVGENGSGKSTVMEAVADLAGFNLSGGSQHHAYDAHRTESTLSEALRLSWMPKVNQGFFLRAETFYDFSTYIDQVSGADAAKLHEMSHGEAFLELFQSRFHSGLFLLDEPEAALSPKRQLSFLVILEQLVRGGRSQFIIATHSPILLGFPGADIWSFDDGAPHQVRYEETDHYQVTKDFLQNPARFLRYLFDETDSP